MITVETIYTILVTFVLTLSVYRDIVLLGEASMVFKATDLGIKTRTWSNLG